MQALLAKYSTRPQTAIPCLLLLLLLWIVPGQSDHQQLHRAQS